MTRCDSVNLLGYPTFTKVKKSKSVKKPKFGMRRAKDKDRAKTQTVVFDVEEDHKKDQQPTTKTTEDKKGTDYCISFAWIAKFPSRITKFPFH